MPSERDTPDRPAAGADHDRPTGDAVDATDAPVWAATAGAPEPGPGGVLTVDLDWRTVVVALVSLVALAAVGSALRQASIAVTLLVIAVFLALALDPVVGALQRRGLGRGWAVTVVLLVVAVAFGLFVALAGPQLVSQSRSLEADLPKTVDSMRDIPILGEHLAEWKVPQKVTEFLSSLPEKIGSQDADLGSVARGVGFGMGAALLGLLVTIGALLEGPRLTDVARLAVPPARRDGVVDVGRIVYSVVGRYFAGSLLIALLNGIWVAVWALVAGVPLSPVLGVWAALTSLIPQIGGLLGFGVVLLVSLAAGLLPAAIMAVTFLFFMLLTNHVLQPTIVGRAVKLSAPVTMLAAIGGFSVAGIVGALFAVPTFGAIKAVVVHVRSGGRTELEGTATTTDPPHHGLHRLLDRFRHREHAPDPTPG